MARVRVVESKVTGTSTGDVRHVAETLSNGTTVHTNDTFTQDANHPELVVRSRAQYSSRRSEIVSTIMTTFRRFLRR